MTLHGLGGWLDMIYIVPHADFAIVPTIVIRIDNKT